MFPAPASGVSMRPKVTVYIPSHNYAAFMPEAVNSVVGQILTEWELILIDDGSTDGSFALAQNYASQNPDRIRAIRNDSALGLFGCANQALELARGEYFMRLDADDFLDESALLVMASFLDRNPDISLVFPNYFYVDADGCNPRLELRKKIGTEAKLLDLPAHGACTMVRTRALKAVGGYSTEMKGQDGHELWLKISRRYGVANIETPLFYYRQHEASLSRDHTRLLVNRQKIKRQLSEREAGEVRPRVVAIIPAKNTYRDKPDIVFRQIAGRSLIDWTIDAAQESGVFDAMCVWTDDPKVVSHCKSRENLFVRLRPETLSHQDAKINRVIYEAITAFEVEEKIYPDIVVVLNIHCPLRTAQHIIEALDTLILYDADSVVSVMEDWNLHFTHGVHGLEMYNPGMAQQLRLEREALFVDNGAVKVLWRDTLTQDSLLGKRVSHIVMTPNESVVINSEESVAFASYLLERRRHKLAGNQ